MATITNDCKLGGLTQPKFIIFNCKVQKSKMGLNWAKNKVSASLCSFLESSFLGQNLFFLLFPDPRDFSHFLICGHLTKPAMGSGGFLMTPSPCFWLFCHAGCHVGALTVMSVAPKYSRIISPPQNPYQESPFCDVK